MFWPNEPNHKPVFIFLASDWFWQKGKQSPDYSLVLESGDVSDHDRLGGEEALEHLTFIITQTCYLGAIKDT